MTANTNVKAIFPVTFAVPGIRPIILLMMFVFCAMLNSCASIAPSQAFCPWNKDTKTGYIEILKMKDTGYSIYSCNRWANYEIINTKGLPHQSILGFPIQSEKISTDLRRLVHERTELPVGEYSLKIGTINTKVSVTEGKINVFWLVEEQDTISVTLYYLGTLTSPEHDVAAMKQELSDFIFSGNSGKICIAVLYLGYYGGTDSIAALRGIKIRQPRFATFADAAIYQIKSREKANKS